MTPPAAVDGDADTVPALIWCPFPDGQSARAAAGTLLDKKLIACANMIDGMVSVFAWRGERDEARETGVLLKTNSQLLETAIARLDAIHPYEQPTIVGWRCDVASPATLTWLEAIDR